MKLYKRIRFVLRVINAVLFAAKVLVVLFAALAGFVTVAAAMIAYLKREQWVKPAYRWARDAAGRRNAAAPGDATPPQSTTP